MKQLRSLNALAAFILFVPINTILGQTEPNVDKYQIEQTMIGAWHATGLSIMVDGKKISYPGFFDSRVFNVVINANKFTISEGSNKLAEITYSADSNPSPHTIDAKFRDHDLQGIYETKDNSMIISLNATGKGRSTGYAPQENEIVLVLNRVEGLPLEIVDLEAKKVHPLLADPEYSSCGSPDWSHDGRQIAFDAWRLMRGENYTQSHIFVVNADGSDPIDLGDGSLPSWSPDGKQIAFSRYGKNNGVWIMNSDGSNKRWLDSKGFCPRWSPKGDQLAYIVDGEKNLCIHDLNTKEKHNLLNNNYKHVYWGFCWSPDAKWICFKGDPQDGQSTAALVSAEGQDKGFKILLPNPSDSDQIYTDSCFSWSPDNKKIVVATQMNGDVNQQLYIIDPEANAPLKKLAGQNPGNKYYFSSWSPDGKKVVLAYWSGNSIEFNVGDGIFKRIFGF